jgi:hypothetical protein
MTNWTVNLLLISVFMMSNSLLVQPLNKISKAEFDDQYMAICTEKKEHENKEYALTAWLDSMDEANKAGKAHEQDTHGHRWRIAIREKPSLPQDSYERVWSIRTESRENYTNLMIT